MFAQFHFWFGDAQFHVRKRSKANGENFFLLCERHKEASGYQAVNILPLLRINLGAGSSSSQNHLSVNFFFIVYKFILVRIGEFA